MWVSRDKDRNVELWDIKPFRKDNRCWISELSEQSLGVLDDDEFPDLKWADEPVEAIIDTKTSLIKRFEILNTMYQNTNPVSINNMPFNEYALKYWDAVDMNNNVETAK